MILFNPKDLWNTVGLLWYSFAAETKLWHKTAEEPKVHPNIISLK